MKSEVRINGNQLQITRIFNAPRDLVFSFWTSGEKLQQWQSCKEAIGCEVVMDFRVGGKFTQNMQLDVKGKVCTYSLTGTYEDIIEPSRIVYSANFGHATTRVTVEFLTEGKGTRVILTHDACPDDFFCQTVSHGTSDSFDKLESLIGSRDFEFIAR